MSGGWHCQQIANGPNPVVVCEREALLAIVKAFIAHHPETARSEGFPLTLRSDHAEVLRGIVRSLDGEP